MPYHHGAVDPRFPRGRHRQHVQRLPSVGVTTQERRWILGGGLASGKSLVRAMLDEAGVATIDADAIGHEVLARGGRAHAEVASRWPGVVVDGEISRPALAAIVFEDPAELEMLESITHPYVLDAIETRVELVDPPIVVEMPLLSPALKRDWARLVVDSRDEVKLARAVRRGMTDADARARLKAQPTRAEWLAAADLVIPNHGSADELRGAVAAVIPHL